MPTQQEYNAYLVNLFLAKMEKDYGQVGVIKSLLLADKIKHLFKTVDIRRYNRIIVCQSLNPAESVMSKMGVAYREIDSSLDSVTTYSGTEICVEFFETGKVLFSADHSINLGPAKATSIIYEKEVSNEYFHTKTGRDQLSPLPGLDSYFAPNTFKSLDQALEYYQNSMALHTTCPILEGIWENVYRIKVNEGPSEAIMRNSLTQFLRIRLRDVDEVMPEQNVTPTNPIDIRVTWKYTKHLALIEIKWLGQSTGSTKHAQGRALSGATQLAEYLDDYKTQHSTNIPRGYLVIFDARRRRANKSIIELTQADIDHFENRDINYVPDYSSTRDDFEKPVRFFMKARLTT